MCFLHLDGLHIFSGWAYLILNGEFGKRKSVHHDDMFCVGSMKKVCGEMRCDDHCCG